MTLSPLFAYRSSPMIRHSRIEFFLSPAVYIWAAVLLLLLPVNFLLSIISAAAIHECCHLAALRMCRVSVYRIEIHAGGARIIAGQAAPFQDAVCALAGPIGSFLCLLPIRQFPLFALCGFLQGLYNLLPIYPLDGGRVLRCIVRFLLPAYGDILCTAVGWCTMIALIFFNFSLALRAKDPLFLFLGAYFLLQTALPRKTPCKEGQNWVQYS